MAIELEVRKKGSKNFQHVNASGNLFGTSNSYISYTDNQIYINRITGAPVFLKEGYDVSEVSVHDDTDTGATELFTNGVDLFNRLVELGYNAFFEDGDIDISGLQKKPTITADTGTEIDLSNSGGNICNMASANSTTTYTTNGITNGGYAIILINATSEPTITGATKIKGSDFFISADMHLGVQFFGTTVQYYFLEL